jgi:hypothetical protein
MPARLARLLPLLLLSLVAAPRAAGQGWPPPPAPAPESSSFRLTPFVGYQLAWTRRTDATLIVGGEEIPAVYEDRRVGGFAAGARMSLPVDAVFAIPSAEGVDLVAEVAYARSAGGYTIVTVPENGAAVESAFSAQPGTNLWLAKLGIGLRLPMALPAELTIAPMLVRLAPRRAGSSALISPSATTHAGVNLGVDLDLPLRIPGLSLQLAGEDNVLYANSELAHRVNRYYAMRTGSTTSTHLPRKASHLALLRAGLSLSF